MRSRMRALRRLTPLFALALFALAGCSMAASATPFSEDSSRIVKEGDGPAAPGETELPVLVELQSNEAETYTRVLLRFEPGSVEPEATVHEYDSGTVPVPGSDKRVDLPGEQALTVTVSPAELDTVNLATVYRDDPAVSLVRVLGRSGDRVTVGIGVKVAGDLHPRVHTRGYHAEPEWGVNYDTIVVSLRNPSGE